MHARFRLLIAATVSIIALAGIIGVGADSASSEIQLQLGDLLSAEERFGEAIEAYARAQDGATLRQRFRARNGTIHALLRLARWDEARDEATLARAETPGDASAVALYGDTLWAAGLFDESEQAFREALALNPDSPRGHHGLAKNLAMRNEVQAAMAEVQTALALSPRVPEFHHTAGMISERLHRFQEAAVSFGNYVNLLPSKDHSDRAAWSRAEVRFLRSFGQRVPFAMDPASATELYTVPFKLVRGKIMVKIRVNDRVSTKFVLDTGAEETVLSQRMARRSRVQPIVYTLSAGVGDVGLRGLELGRLDSLQIGTLKIENVPCLIKDPPLGGLPRREAESFSPLAAGLSVLIDYERRQLTFGKRLPDEPADVTLALRLHRLATIRGTINDAHDVSFVVDTGGEVISISTTAAKALHYRPMIRRLPLRVYGSSGWDPDAFLLPGVALKFNTIEFANHPVVVLNLLAPSALLGYQVGGIIGHNFLSQYRVAIDLQRSEIRLNKRTGRRS